MEMNILEMHKVKAGHGWLWLKHGYMLIMRSPLHAIPLAMVMALGMFLAMLIPVAGIFLALLLMPVLMAGYMRVCRTLEYNEKVEPRQIFAGFENMTRQLVAIGGMLLLGMIMVSMVTSMLGGAELGAILSEYQSKQDTAGLMEALMAPGSSVQLSLMAGLALFFMLMLALQFAPMLVFFDRLPPLLALKLSLQASIRNILPFTLYSVIMQFIALALSLLPFSLGWIVLLPLGLTSMYVAYRDIFSVVQPAEAEAASHQNENPAE